MSNYQRNKDIVEQVRDLQNRVEGLEKFNPLNDGTIDEGGLVIYEGGVEAYFPEPNEDKKGIHFGTNTKSVRNTGGSWVPDTFVGLQALGVEGDWLMTAGTWASDNFTLVQIGETHEAGLTELRRFLAGAEQIYIVAQDALELHTFGDMYIRLDQPGSQLFLTDSGNDVGIMNFSIQSLRFYQMPTTGSAANVRIATTGDPEMAISTSAKRFKQDIESINPPVDAILDIQPKTWRDKNEVTKKGEKAQRHFGAIAEDLVALGLDFLVDFDDEGEPWAIQYERVAIALIPALKSHRERIKAAEDRITLLEKRVKSL